MSTVGLPLLSPLSGGAERAVISFLFPPDDGEPLSQQQQAGPEARVTVGREGGTPPELSFWVWSTPGEEKAAEGRWARTLAALKG